MKNRPLSVTVNLIFILLNASIWLTLGIIIAANAHPALPDLPGMKTAFAVISMVIAALILGLVYFLFKHNRIAYYLILTFFVFTSALTIFDDFGYTDLIVLLIAVVPIVLLIKDRVWYLQPQ